MTDTSSVDLKTIYDASTNDTHEECYIVNSRICKFEPPRNGHFITRIRVCDYYMATQHEIMSDSKLKLQIGNNDFTIKNDDTSLLLPLIFLQYHVVRVNWNTCPLQYKKIYVTYVNIDTELVRKHLNDTITFSVGDQRAFAEHGMVKCHGTDTKKEVVEPPKDEFAELLSSNLVTYDVFEIPQVNLKLNRFNFLTKSASEAFGELDKSSPAREELKQDAIPECVSGVDTEAITTYSFFKEEDDKVYMYYSVVRNGDLVSDIKLTTEFNVEVYDEYMQRKVHVGTIDASNPRLSYKYPINIVGRQLQPTYIVFGIDKANFNKFMKLDTFSITFVLLNSEERKLCALKTEYT